MAVIMGGMVLVIYAFAAAITALGSAGKVSALGLLAIGGAILMIAGGFALIIWAFTGLTKALAGLNLEQINGLIKMMLITMGGMIVTILAFAFALSILGPAAAVAAGPMMAFGFGILMIAGGFALIVLSITGLVKAFAGLGENTSAVAAGISSIVFSIAALIGVAALLVGAVALLAYAMTSASVGMVVFSGALILLAVTMPLLIGIGLAARGVGEAFLNMGIGIKLMADNLIGDKGAITGLQELKTELSSGWKGIADGAIAEIERINTALENMQKISLGSMAANIVTNVIGKSASEKDSADNVETSDHVSQFNTANAHLSAISQNTLKTNSLLSELIVETKRNVKIRTKIAVTTSMGVSE